MKKVLSIVFSSFPNDPRPRREADAMVEAGIEVDMICLKREGQKSQETLYGVNVYRVNIKRKRNSKLRYVWQYFAFLCTSFFMAARMCINKRYDVVHVHNMPDFLVFAAFVPKVMGAKIVLDLHDPMPELYMTKYDLRINNPIIKILILLEKISINFAHLVITPNKAFRDLFIARGSERNKVHIVMNSPMETIFSDSLIQENSDSEIEVSLFKVMFHGYMAEHNGLSLALKAISIVKRDIPNIRFDIFGGGEILERVMEDAEHLNLNEIVRFHGFADQSVIAEHIVKTDIGVIPNLSTPFTDINFPTRIFEYLCLKRPVIAPRTKGIVDYFDEGSICFFEPGSAEDLALVILDLWKNPELKEQYVSRGFPIYFDKRWAVQKERLIELVEGVI